MIIYYILEKQREIYKVVCIPAIFIWESEVKEIASSLYEFKNTRTEGKPNYDSLWDDVTKSLA